MSVPALIALGGNTGEVRTTFDTAQRSRDDTPGVTVTAASRAYRTPAVGAAAGGEFLNAAATIETTLSPHELLGVLQRLEENAGRARTTHWGPRSLDLDLVLFGNIRVASDGLTVPHPGLHWRRFVLDPACEIAEDWNEPNGVTVRSCRQRLRGRPLRTGMMTDDAEFVDRLAAELNEPRRISIQRWVPGRKYRRLPPALWLVRNESWPAADQIAIPDDADAAVALLRDVFAAAAPDPEPEPIGEPLWPG